MSNIKYNQAEPVEVTETEGYELFDRQVQSRLGITAAEFIHNFDTGMYDGDCDSNIIQLIMLLPFARPQVADQ